MIIFIRHKELSSNRLTVAWELFFSISCASRLLLRIYESLRSETSGLTFPSLIALRSTASAAARSEPFCPTFGDEDGGDYAKATELHIIPQHNFKVVAFLRLARIGETEGFQKRREKRAW